MATHTFQIEFKVQTLLLGYCELSELKVPQRHPSCKLQVITCNSKSIEFAIVQFSHVWNEGCVLDTNLCELGLS